MPSEMCVFWHTVAYLSAQRGACVRVKVGHLREHIPNIFRPSAQLACVYLCISVCNI